MLTTTATTTTLLNTDQRSRPINTTTLTYNININPTNIKIETTRMGKGIHTCRHEHVYYETDNDIIELLPNGVAVMIQSLKHM